MMMAYKQAHSQVPWLGLRVGIHLVLSLHPSDKLAQLLLWFCHDDSTKHYCGSYPFGIFLVHI